MKVTIRLSGSMRAIYPNLDEEIVLEISEPMSIKNLLIHIGINPLVAPLVSVDQKLKNMDYVIKEEENVITVIGPLAGG